MYRIVFGQLIKTHSIGTLSALSLALASTVLSPGVAAAARHKAGITIPEEPLGAALEHIQAQTGTVVTYDPDAVRAYRSKPVDGAKSARDAVINAIAGLPLAVRVQGDGSLMVFGVATSGAGDITVIAKRDEAETNYNVNKATSSTRTGQTLKDIPQSTSVISDKLIRDQQAQTVLDAIRNAAGVAPTLGIGQGQPNFLVRGFSATALNNGLSSPGGAIAPVAGVERIEVIRGPVAILSGAANFGGTVNVVPKKPTATPLLNVALEYQTYDDKKVTIDASNAITADRTLSARVIGEYEGASRAAGGYDGRYEHLFAPSLRFKNANVDLTVGINTSETFLPRSRGTVYDDQAKQPRTDVASPLGPKEQGIAIDNTRYYFDGSATPASFVTLVARGERFDGSQTFRTATLLTPPNASGNSLIADSYGRQQLSGEALDAYARFKFGTLGIRHTLIAGLNYTNTTTASRSRDTKFLPANIFQPGTSVPSGDLLTVDDSILKSRTTSYYVQDLIEFGPLHLLGSLRHGDYESTSVQPRYKLPQQSESKNATLPGAGAVLDLSSTVSLYANYLKGYVPQVYLDCQGNPVPDLQSRNVEGGIKADLFGKRLSVVGSAYDIRTNVRYDFTPRAGCPVNRATVIGSGQVNRGIELTVTGNPLPGLNINASYSLQDMSFRNPLLFPGYPQYNQVLVPGVARNSYSLFAAYERPRQGRVTLGGALGVYGTSKTFADSGGTKPIPGGAQLDGNLYVGMGRTRLNIGVHNILDKTIYLPTTVPLYIPIADKRRVIVTLSHAFF